MPKKMELKKFGDKFIEESGFFVGITELSGLSALFGSITFFENLEKVIEAFQIWAEVIFGMLGAAKIYMAFVAAYELIRLSDKKHKEKYVELGKEFDEKEYKKEKFYAWLKFINSAVQACLVSLVVFGGTFAAIAALAVVAPPIFLVVGALSIAYDISQIYRYRNGLKAAYSYYLSGTKETLYPAEQDDWNKVKTHAMGTLVGAALVAVVAIAIMTAPFSFPAIGIIGAGIIGSFIAYNVGKRLVNWWSKPQKVIQEQPEPESVINSKQELGEDNIQNERYSLIQRRASYPSFQPVYNEYNATSKEPKKGRGFSGFFDTKNTKSPHENLNLISTEQPRP